MTAELCSCIPHVDQSTADSWYQQLRELDYEQHEITIFGRKVMEPRTRLHFGAKGTNYRYSGTSNVGAGFPPLIDEIRLGLEARLVAEGQKPVSFNFVLVNCYRDIQDSIGWHSDDESSIRSHSPIASLSLGVTRKFQIRERKSSGGCPAELTIPKGYSSSVSRSGVLTIPLDHGAIIVMQPGFQSAFEHQVPKQAKSMQKLFQGSPIRFNLTFRCVQ